MKPPIEWRPKRGQKLAVKTPVIGTLDPMKTNVRNLTRAEVEEMFPSLETDATKELTRRRALKAAQMRRYRARLKEKN